MPRFNSGGDAHEVGAKLPNELGLYDMTGNVREWCLDDPTDQSRNQQKKDMDDDYDSEKRTICGGDWADASMGCSSRVPADRGFNIGFRVALVLEE